MNGYLKLHRSLLQWEWWNDANTTRLWTYILIKANFKPCQWRGETLKPGQLVTSLPSLASGTGLSVQQTRTSLDRLKSTGEITDKSTNKFRIITVCNWDTYQIDDDNNNRQGNRQNNMQSEATGKQQATGSKINKQGNSQKLPDLTGSEIDSDRCQSGTCETSTSEVNSQKPDAPTGKTTVNQQATDPKSNTSVRREEERIEVPPNPQRGDGQADVWKDVIPSNLPRSATKQKRVRVKSNLPVMVELGSWFNRKPDTMWNAYEALALKQLWPLSENEYRAIRAYYRASTEQVVAKMGRDFRRQNLEALLNNWMGELDRAQEYLRDRNQSEASRDRRPCDGPKHWKEALGRFFKQEGMKAPLAKLESGEAYHTWSEVNPDFREEIETIAAEIELGC